jgi:pimeloyl-ACP methyl ester carboxylesterase
MMNHTSRRSSWRRAALAILAAVMLLVGGGGLATAETPQSRDTGPKPTVVLVHGAWADASGFADVQSALRLAGYPVLEFANPLRSLTSDAGALGAYLQQRTSGPVILVAHSYGGAVITSAARTDSDVRALVYIDAFVPDTGESLNDLLVRQPPIDPAQVFDVVANPGAPEGVVDLYLKDAVFPEVFANGLPRSTQAQLLAAQRPLATPAFGEPAADAAWKTLPSWYILGTQDRIITPELQRFMAERAGARITTVKTGHLAMIARPDVITTTILRADHATR